LSDYTAKQLSNALSEAFRAACPITGSLQRSEQVICLAIELVDISRLGSRDLLAETVRLSAVHLVDSALDKWGDVAAYLAPELEAVLGLEVLPRCSYVARVILGFSIGDCVRLLDRDAAEITVALMTAVKCLCRKDASPFAVVKPSVFTQMRVAVC
jgi:hypothetical protein